MNGSGNGTENDMFFLEGRGGCFQTKKLQVLTQRTVNKICSDWQKGRN